MSVRIKKMPILVARYSWDVQIGPRCWIGGTAFSKRGARRQGERELAKRGAHQATTGGDN